MRIHRLSILPVLAICLSLAQAATAQVSLRQVDGFRSPFPESKVSISATNLTSSGGQQAPKKFEVYLNKRDESIVEMLTGSEAGRFVLITDTSLYLYIPSTNRPVRISPLQRLTGEANFGDIGRLTLDGSYKITSRSKDSAPAGPPQNVRFALSKSNNVEKLTLQATKRTSTYAKITLWIDAKSGQPIRADFFLTSGKHIKSAWYSKPERFNGRMVSLKLALSNPKPPFKTTILSTTAAEQRSFSRRLFSVKNFRDIK